MSCDSAVPCNRCGKMTEDVFSELCAKCFNDEGTEKSLALTNEIKAMKIRHYVAKIADIDKYCGIMEKDSFCRALLSVVNGRNEDSKEPAPRYIVINTDEPYIGEIVEVLKRHGHWG